MYGILINDLIIACSMYMLYMLDTMENNEIIKY